MAKSKKKVRIKYKGRLMVLLLMVVLIVYLLIKGVLFTVGLFLGKDISLEKVNAVGVKRSEDSNVSITTNSTKGALAVAADKKFTLYDKDGKPLFNIDADIKDVVIGDQIILSALNEEGSYIVYNYLGEEIFRSNTGYAIQDMKINNIDYGLLMHSKGYILVDNTGEEISRVSIEDGQVMDVEFQEGSEGILLDVVSVNDDGYDTNIITYDYKGNVISGKTLKDKSCYNIESLINDKVLVLNEGIQVLDKDRNVVINSDFEGQINRFEIKKDVINQDFDVYIGITNNSETNIAVDPKSSYLVRALDSKFQEKFKTEIKGEIKGIKSTKDKLIVFTLRTIYVLDSKGSVIVEKEINKDIIDIELLSDERFVLIDKSGLTIMELNNRRKS